MGFDLSGWSNEKCDETYFRSNVWFWRPLWLFVETYCDDILTADQLRRGNYNDFVKIEGARSLELAKRLHSMIDKGQAKEWIDEYNKDHKKEKRARDIMLKLLQEWTESKGADCGGKLEGYDRELWSEMYNRISSGNKASYPGDLDLLKEFADFCKLSDDGFNIG